jgi:DNA-binding transcriptional LysR family regulator
VAPVEEGLGQSLFRRTARGMLPSDAGSRWIVRFNRVLVELDHILADLAALNGVLEGVVTFGALPLARTLVLPAVIAGLVQKYPRVRVRSLERPYEELAAGLLSGRADFVIGALRQAVGRKLERSPAPTIRWPASARYRSTTWRPIPGCCRAPTRRCASRSTSSTASMDGSRRRRPSKPATSSGWRRANSCM